MKEEEEGFEEEEVEAEETDKGAGEEESSVATSTGDESDDGTLTDIRKVLGENKRSKGRRRVVRRRKHGGGVASEAIDVASGDTIGDNYKGEEETVSSGSEGRTQTVTAMTSMDGYPQ